jgi:hypothetical protein
MAPTVEEIDPSGKPSMPVSYQLSAFSEARLIADS